MKVSLHCWVFFHFKIKENTFPVMCSRLQPNVQAISSLAATNAATRVAAPADSQKQPQLDLLQVDQLLPP
jgi:hypothetical protein